jgi:hypothetical protein
MTYYKLLIASEHNPVRVHESCRSRVALDEDGDILLDGHITMICDEILVIRPSRVKGERGHALRIETDAGVGYWYGGKYIERREGGTCGVLGTRYAASWDIGDGAEHRTVTDAIRSLDSR